MTTSLPSAACAIALVALWALGCRCDESSSAPPTVETNRTTGQPSAKSRERPPLSRVKACRVMRIEREAKADGEAVTVGQLLGGERWLNVPQDAKVFLMHTESGSELVIEGPALVRPCLSGHAGAALASGELQAKTNRTSPVSRTLIATPLGTIEYAQADLVVRSDGRSVNVRVLSGVARLTPATDAELDGAGQVRGPDGSAKMTAKVDEVDLEPALLECEKLAREARERALAMRQNQVDRTQLGRRAAAQLNSRQAARGACGVTLARTGLLSESGGKRAEPRWQAAVDRYEAVPGRPNPPKK